MTQTDALAQFDDAVYKYAHQWMGYANIRAHFELEDVAQLARMWVVKAVETYDPEAGMLLSSWIIQRIRWGLNHDLRGHMGKSENKIPHYSIDNMNEEQSDRWHPSTVDTHGDEVEDFLKLLAPSAQLRLTKKVQEMLYLKFVQGHSYRVIGERFGVTGQRTEQIVKVALAKLKDRGIAVDPYASARS
mgnify:CR=1 FL=1